MQALKIILTGLAIGLMMLGCKSSAPDSNTALTTSPNGHGAEVMRTQCLTCHGDDLIQQQRLNKAGWTREVEKMMRWGAEVKDADKEPLIEYLTANYGQRPLAKQPPASPEATPDAAVLARGKAVFESKCLACHQDDLVKQQRLSKTGWTRSVEKMMRWGVEATDEEKAALVEYLASQYSPAKK